MSMTLKRIDATVLFVADLDRATAFYRDTLGLPLQSQDENSAVFAFETTLLLLLSIAGAQDLLSPDAVVAARPTGARCQLVSFVEDVDAFYRAMVARGVEFVRQPVDRAWGLRTAHFTDPDGHLWEVAQPVTKGADQA